MKLYKQYESSVFKFKFLEATIEGCKVTIKSGSTGSKIIEKVKEYKDEKKAINAFDRYLAKQTADGYFECEGDYNRPNLSSPLELGEAPEDFSERLEKLKMKGLLLYAKHHHSYELEDCLPTYQIIISNETIHKNPIEVLKDVISSSKELMDLLTWYAEIDQESVSKSQWQADFIEETNNNNSSWKALAAECPSLGAYSPVSKLNHINIGILASKLLKDQTEDEAVFELTPDSEDLLESMADVSGEFRSDLGTPLALQCLQRSAKLLAEIRTWLYSGYAITEYDLTSSTTYMVIQRPFAMRVLIAQNKSDGKIYVYFFHMQFDF